MCSNQTEDQDIVYCCVVSEQQHNQDLRSFYRMITFKKTPENKGETLM